MNTRCFGTGNALYEAYHDEEWGVPVHDERHLFEMLVLEGAQAGLSWLLILQRREGYRRAFCGFDPKRVAQMGDEELEELCSEPSIIRNRRKIFSARQNAQAFLEVQKEWGSFDAYLWAFVHGVPVQNRWQVKEEVPCSSSLSDTISKDLKRRGMNFVGTKIIYSFLQAVGVVNDHLTTCPQFLTRHP